MEADGPAPAARRIVVLAFALTAIYFTGFFPPGDNPNELSRIQAIVAFVEHGTFSIDETLRRFGSQEDKSVSGGHFYSNKAPGLIFAGIPVYRLLRFVFPQPERGSAAIFVVVRLLTVSLASVLALARFARRLERGPGGASCGPIVAFAVAFGTPFLYYARSLFSHAWTASLLFLAWELLRTAEERAGGESPRLLLAGLLAGWAAISEYPAAPIGLVLAWRAFSARRWRGLLLFGAGAAPAFALLLWYDAVCFGSPFTLSSAREASPRYSALARTGLFGVGAPSAGIAARILFHPSRGLLLFSPFLVWVVPGAVRWWRSRTQRKDCAVALASVLVMFLPIAAYPNWEGGWSLGVRYLVPALFFAGAAIPWALASPLSRALFLAAAVFAAANFFLLASAFPHVPLAIAWPAANLSWFLIRAGGVAPNLGWYAGFDPGLSLLFPASAAAVVLLLCARRLGPIGPLAAVASAVSLAAFALLLLRPPSLAPWDDSWRRELRKHVLEGLTRPAPTAPL